MGYGSNSESAEYNIFSLSLSVIDGYTVAIGLRVSNVTVIYRYVEGATSGPLMWKIVREVINVPEVSHYNTKFKANGALSDDGNTIVIVGQNSDDFVDRANINKLEQVCQIFF